MNVEEQLKKLVSIPSYVDENCDEKNVGEYLISRLKEIDPKIPVERQKTNAGERFNVYSERKSPTLFVIGHIDTVQPSTGWKTNPFDPIVKDGKLYGLGSLDMKGSLAAFLVALESVRDEIDTGKLSLLFYIDEEYDFLGMKRFIADNPQLSPQLVLSLDGTEKVRSGCRGLIEIDIEVMGKSGHSSKPQNGVNAITSTVELSKMLGKDLLALTTNDLGYSTVNLAYLRGGKTVEAGNKLDWKREGNVIPDYADCTIEVRTVSKEINAKFVIKMIEKYSKQLGVKISIKRIRHDICPWESANKGSTTDKLKSIYNECSLPFELEDIKFSGYVDIGMLEGLITAPKYTIGVSGDNAHAPNEYALVSSLYNAQKIYERILLEYCRKETIVK
ncbi:M20 family metallopeptidase [Candidatus Dojkabacteria bacterium]|nr:M20 family metallopeptidase [Candidatus Dojkabacteria bacterium]